MGLVLDYIVSNSDGQVKAYDSQKRFVDETEYDTFGEFDDHKINCMRKTPLSKTLKNR